MSLSIGLRPEAIALDEPAANLEDVLKIAAEALATHLGLRVAEVFDALAEAAAESDFALGSGIAVPHAALPGLSSPGVALVRTAAPLRLRALDGAPVDLFFVVIYPVGNPASHLQFLAHLAGMCRSRMFRDGLRSVDAPQEALELVEAAEARATGRAVAAPAADGRGGLALISVSGERAADSILVGLIREQLASATIVDAQTVQDAASREVPLFAGFRDLFGDPGGRRMIFVFVDLDRADALAAIVQSACDEERSASAELVVVPVATRRRWGGTSSPPKRTGH